LKISIPELSLVALVGVTGCGKSTFARRHFKPTEVLSSDFCRGLVSDDENSQEASSDAFEILYAIAHKRLAGGRLTVIDATNVVAEDRKKAVQIAREHDVVPVAIVLDIPERICHERNQSRPDRNFGPHVIRHQSQSLRRSIKGLQREGFRYVFTLRSPEEVEAVVIEREPTWTNKSDERGPFDIIGDVHGCFDELKSLMEKLGYGVQIAVEEGEKAVRVTPPEGRKAVFVGDLVDRGPNTPDALRLAMGMVEAGNALCIPGNHDVKLLRKLRGRDVQITHGLDQSLAQLDAEPKAFTEKVIAFLDGLISHYVLDDGKLVVAHAGMKAAFQGRASARVREFALYGETTGETDEFGLPARYNWASDYRGRATVVYGHTPIPEPEWLNHTINIDTGCVFGGRLTALRYPENELVSVPAAQTYAESVRPFLPGEEKAPSLTAQQMHDEVMDIKDVIGKRIVSTRLYGNVTVREENAIAALEVMSRFAADPKWLIYLPPTMSPSETTDAPGLLEHPKEAFAYYRHQGISTVICQEKHMGSRAVVVLGKDGESLRKRFGVGSGGSGIVYTRTGRPFFDDRALEEGLLASVRAACDAAGFWEEFGTDWACFDCELMPWSAKAQELIRSQYASVGAASQVALGDVALLLQSAVGRGAEVSDLLHRYQERQANAARYREAYRRYCWPVESLSDLKLAPFHLLATEGAAHVDKDHRWHMETLGRLAAKAEEGSPLMATASKRVDVTDPASEAEGIAWWESLTERGGEGMVVKPMEFIAKGSRGLVQPAVKCRGREYLRIIYGPEYTAPENLERLRQRGLGVKRSLALREFALGVEALERFVRREPLRRVHECVFGVLAMESEPVDPRL
jgi:protein phosphatase